MKAVAIENEGLQNQAYEADQIQVLEGLEAVRKDQGCISVQLALKGFTI